MKLNTILVGLALVAVLAVGAGLWLTRRKDDALLPAVVATRNIAPEATLTYSSLYPGFTNPKTILDAAIGVGS